MIFAKLFVFLMNLIFIAIGVVYGLLAINKTIRLTDEKYSETKYRVEKIIIPCVMTTILIGAAIFIIQNIMGWYLLYPRFPEKIGNIIEVSTCLLMFVAIYVAYYSHNNLLNVIQRIFKGLVYYANTIILMMNFIQKEHWGYNIAILLEILIINIFAHWINEFEYKILEESESDEEIIDKPVEQYLDLYESRKVQVKNIINILDQTSEKEPFAIMIKGKWGTGKTSLINGVKSILKDRNEDIYSKDVMVLCQDLVQIKMRGSAS